ncbi:MAG: hypothetical protein P1U61_00910 [Legionellaceae bacterium]|nr:hypothetical protein [Legionellaceae bacterium]
MTTEITYRLLYEKYKESIPDGDLDNCRLHDILEKDMLPDNALAFPHLETVESFIEYCEDKPQLDNCYTNATTILDKLIPPQHFASLCIDQASLKKAIILQYENCEWIAEYTVGFQEKHFFNYLSEQQIERIIGSLQQFRPFVYDIAHALVDNDESTTEELHKTATQIAQMIMHNFSNEKRILHLESLHSEQQSVADLSIFQDKKRSLKDAFEQDVVISERKIQKENRDSPTI